MSKFEKVKEKEDPGNRLVTWKQVAEIRQDIIRWRELKWFLRQLGSTSSKNILWLLSKILKESSIYWPFKDKFTNYDRIIEIIHKTCSFSSNRAQFFFKIFSRELVTDFIINKET